jgi:DNA polymerase III subunit epsilon
MPTPPKTDEQAMTNKTSMLRYGLPRPAPTDLPSRAAREVAIAKADTLSREAEAAETVARKLEATGDYKIVRRMVPRPLQPAISGERLGLILDLETTGLDTAHDEVLEIAAVKFSYANDRITSVTGTFQAFQQPSAPIPPSITALTGITDGMVKEQQIANTAIERLVSDVQIVIAHNAAFDRKVAERYWPVFVDRHWACSATGIDWKGHGFGGGRLAYLLAEYGLFHDAHRALDDCHAVLEILARDLPSTGTTGLATLLDRARRPQFRIWAEGAPFELKDALKRRGYRWNDGSDGRPKSWYTDVDDRDTEFDYLRREIYLRKDIDIKSRKISSLDRFSIRV